MKQFYKTLDKLKKKIPTSHPVLVYIVHPSKIEGSYGECYFTGKRFIIRIAKDNWHTMKYTLIHEYAHSASWESSQDAWHGAAWGAAYAACWRAYAGE